MNPQPTIGYQSHILATHFEKEQLLGEVHVYLATHCGAFEQYRPWLKGTNSKFLDR